MKLHAIVFLALLAGCSADGGGRTLSADADVALDADVVEDAATTSPCLGRTSCGTCTLDPSCGFCRGTGTCQSGSEGGPSSGGCSSGWVWRASNCPGLQGVDVPAVDGAGGGGAPVSCGAASTCGTCTPLLGCGFCGSTGRCLEGNAAGPLDGTCSSGWALNPPDCPGAGCVAPQRACQGACVDASTSTTNCGACGRACGAGQRCVAGACTGCGDGRCDASENCASCRSDCGACVSCRGCVSSASCGSGTLCARRRCDGRGGCFGTAPDAVCDQIDGVMCASVSIYDPCTSDADCASTARCSTFMGGSGARLCLQRCAADDECVSPASDFDASNIICSGSGVCVVECGGAGARCPSETRCTRRTDGGFACL